MTALTLTDVIGWIAALVIAVVIVLLVAGPLRKVIRQNQRKRIAANLERGVVEAVVRFPSDAAKMPNSGWQAGSIEFTDGGFRFQRLEGRSSGLIGPPVDLPSPTPLGRRPMEFKQAPELENGFIVTSFDVDGHDVEVAALPPYVLHLEQRAVANTSDDAS